MKTLTLIVETSDAETKAIVQKTCYGISGGNNILLVPSDYEETLKNLGIDYSIEDVRDMSFA